MNTPEVPDEDTTATVTPLPRHAWTVREVGQILGIPYKAALDLVHSGELGHIRAGRYYLVPDAEIHRWLASALKEDTA
jgi:excisionase family DNA binding protein